MYKLKFSEFVEKRNVLVFISLSFTYIQILSYVVQIFHYLYCYWLLLQKLISEDIHQEYLHLGAHGKDHKFTKTELAEKLT